jgi:antitoxin component YwqK of YwqJK toxin-antitoxin module
MSDPAQISNENKVAPTTVLGYKVFQHDWTYRGFQFPFGNPCEHAQVAASGIIHTKHDKSVINQLTFVKELSFKEFKSMCTGITTFKVDTGVVWQQTTYKEGEKHGVYRSWHADGSKDSETTYKHGQVHGLRKHWYSNGQMLSETAYTEGVRHGMTKHWYKNGCQASEHLFLEGVEQDEAFFWNEHGQPTSDSVRLSFVGCW